MNYTRPIKGLLLKKSIRLFIGSLTVFRRLKTSFQIDRNNLCQILSLPLKYVKFFLCFIECVVVYIWKGINTMAIYFFYRDGDITIYQDFKNSFENFYSEIIVTILLENEKRRKYIVRKFSF